jgi:hypothetical protein
MSTKQSESDRVVYRRINGRIVPIRIKITAPRQPPPKRTKHFQVEDVAAAITAGGGAGGSTYAAFRRYSRDLGSRGMRLNRVANSYAKMRPLPAQPVGKTLGKSKKVIPPDMFEVHDYLKKFKLHQNAQRKYMKFSAQGQKAWKAAKKFRKFSLPAAIAAGVAAGTATYVFGSAD